MTKKQTLILTALICAAGVARANVIDETPGGFQYPWPKVYQDWANYKFHKCAFLIDQWDGSWQLHGEPNFKVGPVNSSADLSWDLSSLGFTLHWIVVVSNNGDTLNLYRVTTESLTNGEVNLTSDGTQIVSFALLGTDGTRVPDNGYTFILFGLSLIGLFYARHKFIYLN